jgi:hypothetical protein
MSINFGTITWASVRSFIRQAAALAGLIVTIGNTDHLPTPVRTVLLAISGTLMSLEHYANAVNPATPPNSNPPAPPVA